MLFNVSRTGHFASDSLLSSAPGRCGVRGKMRHAPRTKEHSMQCFADSLQQS